MTVEEIYNWAIDTGLYDLQHLIDDLVDRHKLRWYDDESKLWQYAPTYGEQDEGIERICTCKVISKGPTEKETEYEFYGGEVTEQDVQRAIDIILSDRASYPTSLNYAINYARAAKGMTGHALKVQVLYILNNITRWRHPKAAEVRGILKQFSKQRAETYTGEGDNLELGEAPKVNVFHDAGYWYVRLSGKFPFWALKQVRDYIYEKFTGKLKRYYNRESAEKAAQVVKNIFKSHGMDVGELEGIVVDEEKARISICHRVKDTNIFFSEGIIGALSREQIEKYCPSIEEIERPAIKARHERFKKAVNICRAKTVHLKGTERVKQYLECMKIEAKKEEV